MWYWLAINQASVALSVMPLSKRVNVIPTPEQLIGFPTWEEAKAVQDFLLNASIEDVAEFMTREMPNKIEKREAVYIRPEHPQPPTHGKTAWFDFNENRISPLL
jgi:hypothetical protein